MGLAESSVVDVAQALRAAEGTASLGLLQSQCLNPLLVQRMRRCRLRFPAIQRGALGFE